MHVCVHVVLETAARQRNSFLTCGLCECKHVCGSKRHGRFPRDAGVGEEKAVWFGWGNGEMK